MSRLQNPRSQTTPKSLYNNKKLYNLHTENNKNSTDMEQKKRTELPKKYHSSAVKKGFVVIPKHPGPPTDTSR